MRRKLTGWPELTDLKELLGASEIIYVDQDELDNEYLMLLWAHPGFARARRELHQEFEALGADGVELGHVDRDVARRDPSAAAYPLRRFADEWGISPGAAFVLSRASLDEDLEQQAFARFRREASAVVIWETESSFTVSIPRPMTNAREKAVKEWLKGKRPGQLERRWGLGAKRRWQTNPALVEALPWFQRWNAGEEPMTIWRSLQDEGRRINPDTFVAQLTRLVERMRQISRSEIRSDQPSKSRT